ncbi:MAG: hypothetical protein LBG66_04160, partial [Gallionellaceae bacterium]|nr:hypothetical protein [Gallionellaceae bacterium]
MSQLFENIRSGNFPEVIKALDAGETFDDSMQSQQWSEVYDRLIAGRQYAILQKMIEGGMLPSLDLYECQNYMGTLVHAA